MSDRGMKKWAPYASLIEQSICLEEMRYQKNKIEKPRISNERAEKINNILQNYRDKKVTITYFYDGYLYDITTIIKKVNIQRKTIELEESIIPLSEIIDINCESLDQFYFD